MKNKGLIIGVNVAIAVFSTFVFVYTNIVKYSFIDNIKSIWQMSNNGFPGIVLYIIDTLLHPLVIIVSVIVIFAVMKSKKMAALVFSVLNLLLTTLIGVFVYIVASNVSPFKGESFYFPNAHYFQCALVGCTQYDYESGATDTLLTLVGYLNGFTNLLLMISVLVIAVSKKSKEPMPLQTDQETI